MQWWKRTFEGLNRLVLVMGGVALVGMVLLTCANIFLRLVWLPVPGTFELMGFLGALAGAFALAYTHRTRGHIAVEVLVDTFPPGIRRWIGVVNSLLCSVFFLIVTRQLLLKAVSIGESGEVTETLRISYHPFLYAVAAGFAMLFLVGVCDLAARIRGGRERRR